MKTTRTCEKLLKMCQITWGKKFQELSAHPVYSQWFEKSYKRNQIVVKINNELKEK